jgi:hypothetical protein
MGTDGVKLIARLHSINSVKTVTAMVDANETSQYTKQERNEKLKAFTKIKSASRLQLFPRGAF